MLKDDRWQQTLDVDLRAAMKGTALAAQAMIAQKTQGAEHMPKRLACTPHRLAVPLQHSAPVKHPKVQRGWAQVAVCS